MLVSVIIPVYKVECFLRKCVDSVLNQTYSNLQIILVDDGSPDTCPGICDEYAKKDSRVFVVHKPNGGLSSARNAGLEVAKGDCIWFLDSDDSIEPATIEMMLAAMQRTGADIVQCGLKKVDENGGYLSAVRFEPNVYNKMEAISEYFLMDNLYCVVWNKLYKREVLNGLVFHEGRNNEDVMFTFDVLQNINSFANVSDVYCSYTIRTTSIMGAAFNPKKLDALFAYEYVQRLCFNSPHLSAFIGIANFLVCLTCFYLYCELLSSSNSKVFKTEEKAILLSFDNAYSKYKKSLSRVSVKLKRRILVHAFRYDKVILPRIYRMFFDRG